MTERFDVAIIGAGIAGASVAYFLSPGVRTILIEAEAQPGYHTTGRSAAFYAETYGGLAVQPLTAASRPFFDQPPSSVSPLLRPRGALHVAPAGSTALDAMETAFAHAGVAFARLDGASVRARAPLLRTEWATGALFEPGCADIDVAELHRAFLAGARAQGVAVVTDAPVVALDRNRAEWTIVTRSSTVRAAIVVNAAGAWADPLATLAGSAPLGIAPFRRTVAQVRVRPSVDPDLPLTLDAEGTWYMKPEADALWVSPHDEIPDVAGDARPDEADVALAIDRFERATTAVVTRLDHAWAGLRSFAPDRAPVYGWHADVPGLFWCAGQGGFGIQTAPAAGMLCAALLERRAIPESLAAAGVDYACYAPTRSSLVRPIGPPRVEAASSIIGD